MNELQFELTPKGSNSNLCEELGDLTPGLEYLPPLSSVSTVTLPIVASLTNM